MLGSSVIERYIYRYHVIELDEQLVRDNTAFVLTPLKSKSHTNVQ